jgi:hypothetical protein
MIDEYLKELELIMEEKQKTQELNPDYRIYVVWKTSRYIKHIYVTGMFKDAAEMEEVGLHKGYRKLLALTPRGTKELKKMGFSSKEINERYETN